MDDLIDQSSGVLRVTTDTTITFEDGTIFADTDGGDITISLPAGQSGERHKIINCGLSENVVDIVPSGSELLNGENETETLYDTENLDLQFDEIEGWY